MTRRAEGSVCDAPWTAWKVGHGDCHSACEAGKVGIEVVVWDKWGKRRRGTAVISVGGIRWDPYKHRKRYITITWDKLDGMLDA